MRWFVKQLLRRPLPWQAAAVGVVLALLLFLASLYTLGSFSSVEFDDVQNKEFAEDLYAQPPLAAIKAASVAGGPELASKLSRDLAQSANAVRRSEPGEPIPYEPPEDPQIKAWSDEYVCGLKGWGSHKAVLRKLVLVGYGDCGRLNRFRAKAPALYGGGGILGWLLTLTSPLLLLLLLASCARLALTRRAYGWLYESRIRG